MIAILLRKPTLYQADKDVSCVWQVIPSGTKQGTVSIALVPPPVKIPTQALRRGGLPTERARAALIACQTAKKDQNFGNFFSRGT